MRYFGFSLPLAIVAFCCHHFDLRHDPPDGRHRTVVSVVRPECTTQGAHCDYFRRYRSPDLAPDLQIYSTLFSGQ